MNRAPARMVDAAAAIMAKSKSVLRPSTRAAAGSPFDVSTAPRASSASRTPGPPTTWTRSPAATREAAACDDVTTSPLAGMAIPSSLSSTSATVAEELLVTNSTRWPAARRRATPSAEPGMDVPASQITPSRSNTMATRAILPRPVPT